MKSSRKSSPYCTATEREKKVRYTLCDSSIATAFLGEKARFAFRVSCVVSVSGLYVLRISGDIDIALVMTLWKMRVLCSDSHLDLFPRYLS